MDSQSGGLTPEERQRQTAAEIARQKVLASYSGGAGAGGASAAGAKVAEPTNKYKQAPMTTTQQNTTDWKKYHSAWQDYYQKYYSDYYAKAAREYIQTERMKHERSRADAERRHQEELARGRAAKHIPVTSINPSNVRRPVSNAQPQADPTQRPTQAIVSPAPAPAAPEEKRRIAERLKARVQAKASDEAKRAKRWKKWRPAIAGVTVALVAMFLQYNRLVFAPIMAYVSPGNATDDGITAIDATVTADPGPDPKLIIPKLNVDVPIHFGISNDEATVMDAMNNGVAQFSIPGANAMPGQIGNLVLTGHSAGDIYSNNQYKFIFSGLERLQAGDTIYVNYESKRYTYSVTKLETVEPTDVEALVYETDKPMLTLITCTPLGTSRYRLLVSAEQVDPSPEGAVAATKVEGATSAADMPANEPSFFEGIWNFLTGNS